MIGLSVTVIVDQDIVAVAGSNGFGFQINAYSAKGDYDGAQQYVVLVDPSTSPRYAKATSTPHSRKDFVGSGSAVREIISVTRTAAKIPRTAPNAPPSNPLIAAHRRRNSKRRIAPADSTPTPAEGTPPKWKGRNA